MNNNIPHKGKNVNFTEQEIKDYLEILKQLVLRGQYSIAQNSNRQENVDFMMNYRISSNKAKEILLNLKYYDFCYVATNYKPGYEHENLYIFCKEYELDKWGELEIVEIYIKTNLTQTKSGKDFAIVISFHKLNEPISYLFK